MGTTVDNSILYIHILKSVRANLKRSHTHTKTKQGSKMMNALMNSTVGTLSQCVQTSSY